MAVLGVALALPFACADNGQTGSIGYACVEEECAAEHRERVARVANLSVPHFVDSVCREADTYPTSKPDAFGAQHCRCIDTEGNAWIIEATGSDGASFGAGGSSPLGEVSEHASTEGVVSTERCLAWGVRSHIACVYPTSEARACSTTDARSCDPICGRWEQGLQADAAREYDAELRGTYCWGKEAERVGSGSCRAVVRINDACYATRNHTFYAPTPYDCTLSDEEILTLNDDADPGNIP